MLLAHPAVTAAQAVGRPDVHAGEVPVAFVTLAPGANTTAEELRAWAADRVPEQAAAPKSVTVLDALPVTIVGKPFKPALRAEATREAVAEALRDVPGVGGVRGVVEAGAVRGRRRPDRRLRRARVNEILDRFAINWRMESVMNATPVLAGVLIVAFTVLGTAKLAAVPAMRARAEHVGFSVSAYRWIGVSRGPGRPRAPRRRRSSH